MRFEKNIKDKNFKIKTTKKLKEEYLIEILDIFYEKNFLKNKWKKFSFILRKIFHADEVHIQIQKKDEIFAVSHLNNIKIFKNASKTKIVFYLDLIIEKIKIIIENPRILAKTDFILIKKIQEIANGLAKEEVEKKQILKHLYIDPLTNLYNRYFFNTVIPLEFEKAKRYNLPLGVIYLDIDDFKKINDTKGHLVGDKVLSKIGKLIKDNIRKSDLPIRIGGDEIVLILPFTGKEKAYNLAKKLKEIIQTNSINIDNSCINLTISAGVSEIANESSVEQLVNKVDKALLEAKKEGKNRIIIV